MVAVKYRIINSKNVHSFEISEVLSYLINLSPETFILPESCKLGLITPVYQKNNRNIYSSYKGEVSRYGIRRVSHTLFKNFPKNGTDC